MRRCSTAVAAALATLCSGAAMGMAKDVTPQMEYGRTLKDAQAIAPAGESPFGESINPTTGELAFSQADVVFEGVGPAIRLVRTTRTQQHDKGADPPAFGNWDLSIPRIETMLRDDPKTHLPVGENWRVGIDRTLNRCTQFNAPHLAMDAWWHGYDFVSDDGARQLLLKRDVGNKSPKPAMIDASGAAMAFPALTLSHWQIGCLPKTANGEPGEAYLAISPDGTKYALDHLVASDADTVVEDDPDANTVHRDFALMMATRIEDRFGNWVRYTYAGKQLASISASDGRRIDIEWNAAYPVIDAITVMPGTADQRTWRYAYTFHYIANTSVLASASLAKVVLPDGSAWMFAGAVGALDGPMHDRLRDCTTRRGDQFVAPGPTYTTTVTAPSGAVGTFVRAPAWRARSHVPSTCRQDPVKKTWHETFPPMFGAYVLTQRAIEGPGLAPRTWTYRYPVAQASTTTDACVATTTCTSEAFVDIRDPDGHRTRHAYSTRWGMTEGRVVRTEQYQGESTLLRTTTMTFAAPEAGPWPTRVGSSRMGPRTNVDKLERIAPVLTTTVTQQGRVFRSTVQAFDAFARPTRVARSGSHSRTDAHAYEDHLGAWVVGQPKRTTNVDTGLVESETAYDAATALPIRTYRFGKLQRTLMHHADGMLATASDGRDSPTFDTTVRYSNWKRGTPQRIDYPTGHYRSMWVDHYGLVRSVRDENGHLTCHAYDAAGRIARTQYPSETQDSVCNASAWNNRVRSFQQTSVVEFGLSAGHWREFVQTGRGETAVYYDAMWRPVLTRTYDRDDVANTLSQVVTRYDDDGRVVFRSYPTRAAIHDFRQALPGTRTTYDALGRPTRVEQDAEADVGGVLVSTTEYLAGFTTRSTNPRGKATVTAYLTYDDPATDWPIEIAHPDGVFTDIARDRFGKPTVLARSDATVSATRTYTYNVAQELCRVVEPETGATLSGHDAAGNLAWSAAGLPANTACDAGGDTPAILARKATRTYDKRNRITQLAFADGRGDTTWTYTPDGLHHVLSANNGDGNIVNTTYTYNRRRLLTKEHMQWNAIGWAMAHGYDTNGHLRSQGYPGGVAVDYAPNALGQPTKAGAFATGVTWHANGAIKGFTYGNGITHTATQNVRQLPLHHRDAWGSASIPLDHGYDYDANGNVEKIVDGTDASRTRTMAYDNLDRLTRMTSPGMLGGSGSVYYRYDALDNIVSVSAPGRSQRYCYDGNNRLAFLRAGALVECPNGAAQVAFGYDAQGNVAFKNDVQYTFDLGNRLRATSGGVRSSYVYDALGRRVRDVTTASRYSLYTRAGQLAFASDARAGMGFHYIHLGDRLIAERSYPTGTSNVTVKYQHTDALGTPVAESDANRQITKTDYDPYGRVLNRAMQDGPGFTGHVEDAATGLVQMQQRYYDPIAGRFLSIDPMAVDGFSGWNFNRYNYAANNPYRFKDPDGRAIDTVVDVGSVIYSGYRFATQPSWINAAALGADIVGAAVPFATGLGAGVRAAAHADDVADASKGAANGERAGLRHTRAANRLGREQNKAANGGELKCPTCGKTMTEPSQSKKGVPVDRDAAVGDHLHPKSLGGDGATSRDMTNHHTKCWECNHAKKDKLP